MSRTDAVAALSEARVEFTSGITWLPSDVLDEVAMATGSGTHAEATAAVAASMPVDLVFVGADLAEPGDAVAALHAADIAAVWAVEGVFTRVARSVGWTETLRMTAANPGELAARLDEALHEALVDVRVGFEFGVDAVLVGDDLAGPSGLLLSPDYILDALVPCYRRLAIEAGGGSLLALFHSDGEIRALMPALARAGFSGVHLAGLGADAFAASAKAARLAGLTVLGGIGVQALSDDARDAGERAAATASALGGVIVCDDGGITTFGQLVALGAAIDAARYAYRHLSR